MSYAFALPTPSLPSAHTRGVRSQSACPRACAQPPLRPTPSSAATPLPLPDHTVEAPPPPPAEPRKPKLSLPTMRERRWLLERKVGREDKRPMRSSRQPSFHLSVWRIVQTAPPRDTSAMRLGECVDAEGVEEYGEGGEDGFVDAAGEAEPAPRLAARGRSRPNIVSTLSVAEAAEVLRWAYIVRVRVQKSVLGKRAVVRNRAQRRVRAALRMVFPLHAMRGHEYICTTLPGALVTPFPELKEEAEAALRATKCWKDFLTEEEIARPRYKRRSS